MENIPRQKRKKSNLVRTEINKLDRWETYYGTYFFR